MYVDTILPPVSVYISVEFSILFCMVIPEASKVAKSTVSSKVSVILFISRSIEKLTRFGLTVSGIKVVDVTKVSPEVGVPLMLTGSTEFMAISKTRVDWNSM